MFEDGPQDVQEEAGGGELPSQGAESEQSFPLLHPEPVVVLAPFDLRGEKEFGIQVAGKQLVDFLLQLLPSIPALPVDHIGGKGTRNPTTASPVLMFLRRMTKQVVPPYETFRAQTAPKSGGQTVRVVLAMAYVGREVPGAAVIEHRLAKGTAYLVDAGKVSAPLSPNDRLSRVALRRGPQSADGTGAGRTLMRIVGIRTAERLQICNSG